ncbi:AMIN domain-containing protein [Phormidium sp. FACHB-1136]|uniref:AMIN domain-containing protein n=1 Tax=Phormidium sp. FACHB-1136 TaxID=2692848 RepID=UPI001682313C|nr:AMIN domain-containing protein [Phormidium sp. FACHB-1136]
MNPLTRLSPLLLSGALLALPAAPATAATSITNVRLNPTATGLDLVFDTEGDDASNVFTTHQGNTLRADLTRTQLNLPEGERFQQENPTPGIALVSVVPLDANSVRVTIEGTDQAPTGAVNAAGNRVVLSVRKDGAMAQAPTPVPETLATVPDPNPPATLAQAQSIPVTPPPAQPDVLVPNPEVVIDGVPVPQPQLQQAPPFLPRAVAPPVGDMSFAESITSFRTIDLGTNERIPRLLLRDAPAREVLGLLARAAGLNLVYTPAAGDGAAAAEGGGEGTLVSLDIEDESVQDVFNHVLRISGLEANKVGRSIYVGPQLPVSAQNIMTRTLRLNQVTADVAANFLVALGAESAISRDRLVTNVNAVAVTENAPPLTQTETTTVTAVETRRVDYEDSTPIFRGLQVIGDERTNSVTLVGRVDLVNMATEQLTRLDIRRRQVAVNVRVIDVNLSSIDNFGTSFSFQTGSFSFDIANGVLGISRIQGVAGSSNFILNLLASIESGNSKILTDPTLIIQENQTATVSLTTDVPVGFVTQSEASSESDDGGSTSRDITESRVEREQAGLSLLIRVDRIDDNGFVSLSAAPTISSPVDVIADPTGTPVVLLSRRSLNSGLVRVRDSQTLILSGIIQETERNDVTKVPILGDIPILGALFRRQTTTNERRELIVLLTPQILDDSDQAVWGYRYTPGEQVQEMLENQQR